MLKYLLIDQYFILRSKSRNCEQPRVLLLIRLYLTGIKESIGFTALEPIEIKSNKATHV